MDIRCFLAINFPDHVVEEFLRVQRTLKDVLGNSVRWTRREQLHLTIKFLGEIPPASVEEVEGLMTEIASQAACFDLKTTELGAFPDARRPRVFWIAMEDKTNSLAGIHQHLERQLAGMGFEEDTRAFKPHVTLGRVKDTQFAGRCEVRVQEIHVRPLEVTVTSLELMRSVLKPTGAEYSALAQFALTK